MCDRGPVLGSIAITNKSHSKSGEIVLSQMPDNKENSINTIMFVIRYGHIRLDENRLQ